MRKEKDGPRTLCQHLQPEEITFHSVLDYHELAKTCENMDLVVVTVLIVNLLLRCQRRPLCKKECQAP
jgi:hypothetical protein